MLGSDVGTALSEAKLPWVGTGREVDVTDWSAVERFAQSRQLSAIVNCAAYTAVDRAEDEPEAAARLNVDAARNLARQARSAQIPLVHISTDYVFAGMAERPYSEDDPVAPGGVYATTKEAGERAVREACDQHYILRTAWLYGAHGKNFVDTMLGLMNQRDSLGVVADQFGAPTWTVDLARIIVQLLQRSGPWGTYHTSAEGQCSWYDFAQEIYDVGQESGQIIKGKIVAIAPLTTGQYPTKARRPAWSVLSKAKLEQTFGLKFPPWRDSLRAYLQGKQ